MRAGHHSLTLVIEGSGAEKLDNECGGHRIQRVPRSEKRGRVHSSTVTVAVLGGHHADLTPYQRRSKDDFDISFFSGTGPGGQNRNKVQASARVRHIPTGIVKTAQTRSRENSLAAAMAAIHAELDRLARQVAGAAVNGVRRVHVGTGERSDKRRTYQFQNGIVIDHQTGRKAPVERIMMGRFDLLW